MRAARTVVLTLLVASGGCATLYGNGQVPVVFQSDGRAEVLIDGRSGGHTPLTIALDNERPVTVTFRQAGWDDVTVRVGTRVRWGFLLADLPGLYLFGVPLVIDLVSGEYRTLDARMVHVRMLNAPAPAQSRDSVR